MQYYHKKEAIERMNEWGAARRPFVFMIDYLQERSVIEEVANVDPAEWLFNLNGVTNETKIWTMAPKGEENQSTSNDIEPICTDRMPVQWESFPQSFDVYSRSFGTVRNHILAGNSFLTNLTCATPVKTNLSLRDIYDRSHALYKVWVKDGFTVFSPEIFVRIKEGKIYSYPMKGTIDASLPHAEQVLMDDVKEAAEHATIVDLIRNDLSMVADHVHVTRYRYIDTLQTNRGAILQTSSEIEGTLPDDFHRELGSVLFRLLPAGSITGAPKKKTVEIIQEAETYDRGFYTGVMGYFDGTNLDSAVMIRFIEQTDEGLVFKSGGGITCQSEAESEYNEMKQKVYVPIY